MKYQAGNLVYLHVNTVVHSSDKTDSTNTIKAWPSTISKGYGQASTHRSEASTRQDADEVRSSD